jgi:hypothetical protein
LKNLSSKFVAYCVIRVIPSLRHSLQLSLSAVIAEEAGRGTKQREGRIVDRDVDRNGLASSMPKRKSGKADGKALTRRFHIAGVAIYRIPR